MSVETLRDRALILHAREYSRYTSLLLSRGTAADQHSPSCHPLTLESMGALVELYARTIIESFVHMNKSERSNLLNSRPKSAPGTNSILISIGYIEKTAPSLSHKEMCQLSHFISDAIHSKMASIASASHISDIQRSKHVKGGYIPQHCLVREICNMRRINSSFIHSNILMINCTQIHAEHIHRVLEWESKKPIHSYVTGNTPFIYRRMIRKISNDTGISSSPRLIVHMQSCDSTHIPNDSDVVVILSGTPEIEIAKETIIPLAAGRNRIILFDAFAEDQRTLTSQEPVIILIYPRLDV